MAADLAVVGEREQRLLRHRVDRVRRRERLRRRAGPRPSGSFVPVLAQSSRCERAPALSKPQPAIRGQQLAVRLVGALGRSRCRAGCSSVGGTLPATATSQRLTNSEATERDVRIQARPRRVARCRGCRPRAAATYCSREKSSVTLIGTPAKIDSSIAGMPSGVPGILMKRFGRAGARRAAPSPPRSCSPCRRRASARPRATPSRRRRWSPRGPAGRDRRRASGRRARARRTAPRPVLPAAVFSRIAAS